MKKVDVVIIGGGAAGMASAISCFDNGVKDILILEKDDHLGGILNQCIHNGFGIHEFKEELTGPEYMHRFIDQIHEKGIEYKLNTMVTNVTKDKIVSYTNKEDGFVRIQAGAIVVASGSYERTAGQIRLEGDRPNGVITAGLAQKYLNIHGYLVGKRVVILGSGDIGLIMARRMTLEGAKVLGVVEINPIPSGLNRNIAQCLNDFDIPSYLSHTVKKVVGKNNVEQVIIQKVDENYQFIDNTEIVFDCDTLLLSVGLIPYIPLLTNLNCPIGVNKGPLVSEDMETMLDGFFVSGNALHVHDVVDYVTSESRIAGKNAARYVLNKEEKQLSEIVYDENISYVIPQLINKKLNDDLDIKFRVKKVINNAFIEIYHNDKLVHKEFHLSLIPSEMIFITLKKDKVLNGSNLEIKIKVR